MATDPEPTGTRFELEGEETSVTSTVIGLSVNYASVEDALARVETAIDECVRRSGTFGEEFGEIPGLPSEAIGYRSTFESSAGPVVWEKVYAPTGDGRIVVLGVEHVGSGEASVDVVELLPVALERADESRDD